jgi:hypothetical protein
MRRRDFSGSVGMKARKIAERKKSRKEELGIKKWAVSEQNRDQ